jgi:DNA-binding response OmpR family regulator
MAHILSISYDEMLLRTRDLLLSDAGHVVTSAFGYHEGIDQSAAGDFDMVIIGHSIPHKDKLDFIAKFRESNPQAAVIALTRAGEPKVHEVDYYVNPGDPEELLRSIAWIINPASDRRKRVVRIR